MQETMVSLFQSGVSTALIVAVPLLIVAWGVSVVVGFVQSLLQLPDPAVSFLPKLAVTAVVFGYISPWVVSRLAGFAAEVLGVAGP